MYLLNYCKQFWGQLFVLNTRDADVRCRRCKDVVVLQRVVLVLCWLDPQLRALVDSLDPEIRPLVVSSKQARG